MEKKNVFITNTTTQPVFTITNPPSLVTFKNPQGEKIGELNMSGDELTFTGNADESATTFFNHICFRYNEHVMKVINNTVLNGTGDSDRHLGVLFSMALASRGKTFIELGVRNGDTTLPLLAAAKLIGGKVISVDIEDTRFVCPKEYEDIWTFIKSDAISFLDNYNDDIDLIYVDDWHSYEHVKKELEILDTKVSPSTVILLHDLMYGETCPFYHSDLTQNAGKQWENGGPYRAVAELNPQFWEFSTLPWNNGLTILRKKYSNKYKQK